MPDQDPWELNYAPAAPPPQASTGYSVKGLTGTEPKIQLGPVSGTNTSVAELDPWEKPYQRPQTPATSLLDEGVRLAKIGATASGLKMAKDVIAGGGKAAMDFIVGNPVNPQDVQQFKSGAGTLIGGIRDEPARVWQELVKSGEAMTRGDLNAAADHLWFSVPIAGAAGQGMAEYLNRGDIKGALAHAFGSLLPVAHEPAIGAIKALPEAAETTSAAASGAAKGGWQGATGPTVLPIKIKGVQVAEIPGVPASIAGAVTGGGAGALLGGPKGSLAGAAVGAAIPAVRGAIKGGRAAVADLRTARAAAASAEEAAAPPVVNPPRQLPPGPIITPAPADASFVRSVPAEYPPVELTAQEQALAAHILENVEPLPPRLALPPAPPTPPDTSFVRGVPGQYPEVIPPALRTNATAEAAATKLRDMMQESGTAPTPETPPPIVEPIDFAAVGRAEKVDALHNYLTANKIPLAMVDEFGPKEWQMVSKQAGVKPPSAESIKEIRTRLAEYEAASTRPAAAGKMSPEEATADFAARRATRTEAAPGRTEVLPPPKAEPQVRVKSLEEAQRILAERRAQQEAATEASMQREATTRVQRITQYLKDQGFSSKAIHNFGPGDWKMVGHAAEGLPPTAQEIAAIKQATVVR